MIEINIERICGHREKIMIMGFSGDLSNVPLEYREKVGGNIAEQKSKLCLPCLIEVNKKGYVVTG